jgi:conjugal transfer pilus assembly protein TraD
MRHKQVRDVRRAGQTYLGHGFLWTMTHRQAVERLEAEGQPAGPMELGGVWGLQGIEPEAGPVFIPNELLSQHLLICGTTGCGKTRLLEWLALQAVARGDAVAIIDPKGDAPFLDRVAAIAARCGRSEALRFFSPLHPEKSARYNPIAAFEHPREVADRIAALIPGTGDGASFRNFAWDVVHRVAMALQSSGQPMTLGRLKHYALEGLRELEGCPSVAALLKHPREHYQKMISSLIPVLGRLTAGPLAKLMSTGSPDLLWPQIHERRQIAYFFLGSLTAPESARDVARLALLDFQGYLGARYARSAAGGRLCLLVDEFSDVAVPEFIGTLNKSRGAGVSIAVAAQTVSDLEAALGSEARAMQVIGNASTVVQFRSNDERDAELFSGIAGREPARVVSESHAYEPALLSSGSSWVDDYRAVHSTTVQIRDEALVPPHLVSSLANLHAFARVAGRVHKIQVPLLRPADVSFLGQGP